MDNSAKTTNPPFSDKGGAYNKVEASSIPMASATEVSTNTSAVYLQGLRLVFGAGGIYIAFLYNGMLQEDVFRHKSSAGDGSSFTQAWLFSVMEAAANVVIGFFGRYSYVCFVRTAKLDSLPQKHFVISGATQVLSKSFKSLALANGLSFPIATLVKSSKMAPVMIGSLVLGGASYSLRDCAHVLAVIAGTAIVSMGKSTKSGEVTCTPLGIAFILLSLTLDGITGGVQKALMTDMAQKGVKLLRPYDLMYYTNLYMMIVAGLIALWLDEFQSGFDYIKINPELLPMILKFSLCSAVGQSFIFYTIAHFDPLVCTTVTTTRKIFSVVLSILFKGNALSLQGWSGVLLATTGIVSEVLEKFKQAKAKASKLTIPYNKTLSQEKSDVEMASLLEGSGNLQKRNIGVSS